MRHTYSRKSDGMIVTQDEALENGALKDGYRIQFSVNFADQRTIITGDSAMISIHDAIAELPSEFGHKMHFADGLINGTSRCEIESGIRTLNSLRYSLDMASQGHRFGSLGMVTDSERASCKRVLDYIDGKIAAAQERAHRY